MLVTITCSCVVGVLCLVVWWLNSDNCDFDKIPGPPGLPIIGNSLDFLLDKVDSFKQGRAWANRFGDIYRVKVPGVRVVNVYTPKDIEVVLSSTKHNEKDLMYNFLKPWLQEGLLISNGSKWHSRRKILTPAFHFDILRHFTQILEENSWRMVRDLETQLNEKQINLVPLMSTYSLNTICETVMGTRLQHDLNTTRTYKKALQDMGECFLERLLTIWLHPSWLFNMSSVGKKQRKALDKLRIFPGQVIKERRKYLKESEENVFIEGTNAQDDVSMNMNNGKKRLAMLDLLLSAEKKGHIDSNGIQEEVETFMFEGHDTTATALIFTLMLLANNKDVQDKVVQELEVIFEGTDRPATIKDLQDMKYLECCIKESLRLYPPVVMIGRLLSDDTKLSGYSVPAGTQCFVGIFDLHRRADLFPEPLQFRPDRFLAENCINRHPYAYIPFSAGPRNCIGQKFAMLEIKSTISSILRTYHLLPVTEHQDLGFSADLVLRPNSPVYIKLSKRKVF